MHDKNNENLEGLSLPRDVMRWYRGPGEDFFRRINVKEGQVILDFGCRVGNYTIPAAKVVAPTGKVYALDKDHWSVNKLIARAKSLGVDNIIVPLKTRGELTIALPDKSVDVVLFYDVIYSIQKIDGTLNPFRGLLREFYRITRTNGTFSLFVEHLERTSFTLEDIFAEIQPFFSYEDEFVFNLLHWDSLREGVIQIFRK